MRSVNPEASTTMPDPNEQRGRTAVYRLYDADGTPLYIGISDDPERRFKQHRDSKPWWPQVARKTIEWHPNRTLALKAEATAIEAETPAYNIDHNPIALQNPVSTHWPPAGMPADMVNTVQKVTQTLSPDDAQGVQRAAAEGFTRTHRDTAMLDSARTARIEEWCGRVLVELAKPTPAEQAAAILAECGIEVVDWDTSDLPEHLRDKIFAVYDETDGRKILGIAADLNATRRLHVAWTLLTQLAVAA